MLISRQNFGKNWKKIKDQNSKIKDIYLVLDINFKLRQENDKNKKTQTETEAPAVVDKHTLKHTDLNGTKNKKKEMGKREIRRTKCEKINSPPFIAEIKLERSHLTVDRPLILEKINRSKRKRRRRICI